MKKLLCIVSSMDRGGAETFLMKVYRNLDHNKYQMDFCVSKKKEGYYDNEIKNNGGRIFFVPPKSKNPFKTFYLIMKLVKKEKYDSVLRTSQQSLATLDLLAAKMGGAKNLIYRSSNAGMTGNIIKRFINFTFSFLPRIIPNVKIAPSTEAAKFVFGEKAVSKNQVSILHNGLDYQKFAFNLVKRNIIRKELNIDNKIVFGHVGRFNEQKNHKFLIDVFEKIHKQNKNTCLLLIGEGELEEKIKNQIKSLSLENSVIMLGPKANIEDYFMAMDLFIFPSFFEGMPNVIIEAQASGLRCLISNFITKEANITGLVTYLDLNASLDMWVDEALKHIDYKRNNYYQVYKEKGYLIEDVTKKFIKIVFRM